MTVADRIARRRKELDITQEELAKMLGLSGRSSINKIEKAGNNITLKNIRRIAKALNCSEEYLMGYEDVSDETDTQNTSSDHRDELYEILISYIDNFNERQKKLLKSYIELLSKED